MKKVSVLGLPGARLQKKVGFTTAHRSGDVIAGQYSSYSTLPAGRTIGRKYEKRLILPLPCHLQVIGKKRKFLEGGKEQKDGCRTTTGQRLRAIGQKCAERVVHDVRCKEKG